MPHHLFFMSIINLIIILNLLIMLPKHVTSSTNPHYVHHHCAWIDNNYTTGSMFESNLNDTLVSILPTNASLTGFSNFAIGEGIDQLYALSYCRGDIKGQDCRNCFEVAGETILQRCHLLKAGIIWYEECTLHYSNQSTIFSADEVTPNHRKYNFSSILKSLDQHKKEFESLMNGLIVEAADFDHRGILQGFAVGETSLLSASQNVILSGRVQCRPDIIGVRCETCLRLALKQMDGWSTTMIYLPNCNLRFDLYPSQISHPASLGGRGNSVPLKVVVPVVVVVSVVLLGCIVCLIICRRRNRQQQQEGITADQEVQYKPENEGESSPSVGVPFQKTQNLASNDFPEPSAPPLPQGMSIDQANVAFFAGS